MMMVPSMMMEAEVRTRWMRARVRTRAVRERGGRDMMAGSTGSTPRDCAGGPSMRISGKYEYLGYGAGLLGRRL